MQTQRVSFMGMGLLMAIMASCQIADDSTAAALPYANAEQFQQVVLEEGQPAVVVFSADWCGPCQKMKPNLAAAAAEHPDVHTLVINVDHDGALAQEYGVRGIPAIHVWQAGEIQASTVGAQGRAQLEQLFAAAQQ